MTRAAGAGREPGKSPPAWRARMRAWRSGLSAVAVALIVLAAIVSIAWPSQAALADDVALRAAFSLLRMAAAYALALAFAVAYGTTAATNARAATVMLPVLDILQSIPILGFFPAALVFFVSAFQGHPVGLELAVVFLVFTSMSWNMAFGVYEALTTIPHDLEDAATEFGLSGWLRFRRLVLPAAVPKLVYNSILSWTNGWFFLVASEVFTAYGLTYTRPGIGSFLADAGARGDTAAIALGLGALAAVVLAVDAVVWRPLESWADRFRLDAPANRTRAPRVYEPLRWIPRIPGLWHRVTGRLGALARAYNRAAQRLERAYVSHPKAIKRLRTLDLAMLLALIVVVTGVGITGIIGLLSRPLPAGASDIPGGALRSFLRLLLAYLLAIAWTLPLAAYLGRHPRAARAATPLLEVFASLPATALLPVIVGFALALSSGAGIGAELAAVLIALFSMQWYLLFNLLGGVRGIPAELIEAARAFGLKGRTYWRRLLLPALVPSFLTGSVTAWGAGWNALIVSEYFRYHGRLYAVPGLGSLMDRATFELQSGELLLFSIFAMIAIVLLMNKALWRPLTRRAAIRYRFEVT
ncbi:MAG TPA: ABC transporter permease subunit [Thermoplasmata archaeon]|nr:ABC transporter permease subunit [Thermoplasmata archaeon]